MNIPERCRSESPFQRQAFTLIELLVVVAIIGILAGLLLPALSSARTKALTASSINNLKQIHLLVRTYVDENNSYWPTPEQTTGPINPLFWRRTVWEHTYGKFSSSAPTCATQMNATAYGKVMWCPLMVRRYGKQDNASGRGSYSMNVFYETDYIAAGTPPRKDGEGVGNIEPYLTTGSPAYGPPEFGASGYFRYTDPSFGPWANVAYDYTDTSLGMFVDGHVETIAKQKCIGFNGIVGTWTDLQ